ncbi:hypothetical protein WOC76_04755 [Methylocystis sp. IM3]|uniref:hypothetical protein n=1 Tax=unclassified Methylocystis TaxID=2625913 RepID=UPI0030F7B42E
MTALYLRSFISRPAMGIGALAVASVLFTLGFACAVPLAAFAAIAALSFGRRDALLSVGAVWLANQFWGFTFMHYPLDGETLAWGGALGVIAAFSCEAAGQLYRRLPGAIGVAAAFLGAFVVYEGALIMIDLIIAQNGDDFAFAVVTRIFLINACAFGGLLAIRALVANVAPRQVVPLAPRHI